MINVDARVKSIIYVKNYILNPATCSCENGKYLSSVIDNSVIMCDEIIEETKTVPTNFNEKDITCKTQNFYSLLDFLLITIILLIAVIIYCYLIEYRAKQRHLLSFQVANNKLREVLYQ